MQTMAAPEEIQKERFARIDERFEEVNRRITEGREETRQRFDRVEGETGKRFDRVEGDIRELKTSVASIQESVIAIHSTLTRISVGLALTFASVVLTKAF